MTRLHIGNLSLTTTTATLTASLKDAGQKIARVEVVSSREFGRSRGFAFVDLEATEDGEAAVAALQGREVEGRAIKVAIAHGLKSRFGGEAPRGKPATIQPLR